MKVRWLGLIVVVCVAGVVATVQPSPAWQYPPTTTAKFDPGGVGQGIGGGWIGDGGGGSDKGRAYRYEIEYLDGNQGACVDGVIERDWIVYIDNGERVLVYAGCVRPHIPGVTLP